MEISDDAFRAASILIEAYGKVDVQAAINRALFLETRASMPGFAREVTQAVFVLVAESMARQRVKQTPVD